MKNKPNSVDEWVKLYDDTNVDDIEFLPMDDDVIKINKLLGKSKHANPNKQCDKQQQE